MMENRVNINIKLLKTRKNNFSFLNLDSFEPDLVGFFDFDDLGI